jgi:hypothetical protein
MPTNQKVLVDTLKVEWNNLWRERLDDKVRAEGIALSDYPNMFVDKGTIIHATRDFKALNFKEILEQHEILNADRYIPPDRLVGGWTKFIKDNIAKKTSVTDYLPTKTVESKKNQRKTGQPKKGGRGWLHI